MKRLILPLVLAGALLVVMLDGSQASALPDSPGISECQDNAFICTAIDSLATVGALPPLADGAALTRQGCGAGFQSYTPRQVQRGYDMNPLYRSRDTGRGATIAIVDPFGSPTIRQDLHHFDVACGLPDPPKFRVVTPVGKPPRFYPSADRTFWAGESTLDVEWAHAMAPGANLVLVETPVSETEGVHGFPQIVAAENDVIRDRSVDVISQSFGAAEQTFPNRRSILDLRSAFVSAKHAGVTVLAASGDYGATDPKLDGRTPYHRRVIQWPASDPLVTAVGGTGTYLDSLGNRVAPDTVWNDSAGASGGGRSSIFRRPSYQDVVAGITGNARGIPDVSLAASGAAAFAIWATYPGAFGWSGVAGTSVSTPMFAGIVAIADQIAHHRLGLINPSLYQLAKRSVNGIIDITAGNNSFDGVTGFTAESGYDLASGLGTVDGNVLARKLAASGRRGQASAKHIAHTSQPRYQR